MLKRLLFAHKCERNFGGMRSRRSPKILLFSNLQIKMQNWYKNASLAASQDGQNESLRHGA